jgi:hypothetical protein
LEQGKGKSEGFRASDNLPVRFGALIHTILEKVFVLYHQRREEMALSLCTHFLQDSVESPEQIDELSRLVVMFRK